LHFLFAFFAFLHKLFFVQRNHLRTAIFDILIQYGLNEKAFREAISLTYPQSKLDNIIFQKIKKAKNAKAETEQKI